MCYAVALVAAAALMAASGAYQADAQKKAGQYQAEVAEQNAQLDDLRAEQAGTIGAINEERKRQQVRQQIGTQRATLAANGVDLGSGTALDMVGETAALGEADALTMRFNAMNEAWGYRTSAINERNAGAFAKAQGRNAAKGTYLTTAASIASMFAGGGGFGGGGGGGSSTAYGQGSVSGMSYSAPATSSGASWLNGYGG